MNTDEKIYYVYAWYFKDTGEIFHIGKGKNDRCHDIKNHRNEYFLNVINKYPNNVDVKILIDGLSNDEALAKERELIKQYKEIGQCKTNIHEGGCGGNTGKYDDPERSRKLSEAASKRVGEKNSMFGKHHTIESRKKMSDANKGKHISEEHKAKLIVANTGRVKTKDEIEKIRAKQIGIPKTIDQYEKMMDKNCPYMYFVELHGKIVFQNISSNKLTIFCNEELHISSAIIWKCMNDSWQPKFKRRMHLRSLKIYRIAR